MSKVKNIGVLFSGGLDSTYLIYKNLKEGHNVTPIYIEIENNSNKSILEKNRIELLLNEFKKEFSGYERLSGTKFVTNIFMGESGDGLFFKQIPIWILGLIYAQGQKFHEFQIGYVCNDDAVSYIDVIQKIYKSYREILDFQIPLKFPIIKMKKEMIASELPKNYMDLVVSCENPTIIGSIKDEIINYEPCCCCVPCNTIINGNYYGTNVFPEIYSKGLLERRIGRAWENGYKLIN